MKNSGFTLIETMVSMAILIIAVLPLFTLGLNFRKMITEMKIRTEAMTAAQQVAEEYREGTISALPMSGTQTQTLSYGNHSYVVNTDICNSSTYCTTATRDFTFRVMLNGHEKYRLRAVFSEMQ